MDNRFVFLLEGKAGERYVSLKERKIELEGPRGNRTFKKHSKKLRQKDIKKTQLMCNGSLIKKHFVAKTN
jgi:hypothetical protein